MNTDKCPECNGKLVYTNTEVYCEKCGLVIDDELIVNEQEKNVNKKHNGPPITNLNPIIWTTKF